MKVKILSMQKVINYGSFMQAYALKKIIESYGHNVEFCDFKSGSSRHRGEKVTPITKLEKLKKLPSYIISPKSYVSKKIFNRKKLKCFHKTIWPLLNIDDNVNLDYKSDLFVIGSDEVFNYTQNHAFGYVPAFFGYDNNSNVIISYAASAGYTDILDIEKDGMIEEIKIGFRNFDMISVRDQNTYEIVKHFTNKVPTMVLDPTLLYDFTEHNYDEPDIAKNGKYLLVYAYTDRLDSKEDIKLVKSYAKKRGLKIVSAGFFHEWCDYNLVLKPFELLSLFKYAEGVITDTFHGTIFSIINKRPFLSLLRYQNKRGSNSNKLKFLLKQLGLESRVYNNKDDFEIQLNKSIQYDKVDNCLEELRKTSNQYLSDSLSLAMTAIRERV
ncbi:MAG: polysaccharide pyruvyl transferase family protein [Candidatus Thiodiazotropha sp. 6PLUC2]